jgi:ABC-2 type transport system ATP-binding protein
VEIKCDGPLDENVLRGLAGVHTVKALAEGLSLTVEQLHKTLPLLLAHLQQSGRTLTGLSTHHATLEDVFVHHTGRHLRD